MDITQLADTECGQLALDRIAIKELRQQLSEKLVEDNNHSDWTGIVHAMKVRGMAVLKY
jgi:hypothetical protein